MKIIWVKDGNKGHEKQVKVLLSELSKDINFKIIEDHDHSRSFKRILDIVHHLTYYFFKRKKTFKNYREVCRFSNRHVRLIKGQIGKQKKPSTIQDFATGKILRK